MKRHGLMMLVGILLAASAAPIMAQPQPAGQQANVPTSHKVIKDPAEYNEYVTALNTTDPLAKGRAMEAFVAKYANSIVKIEALEQAMHAYQQAGNDSKVEQLARRILQIDPTHVRALAIVVFIERSQIKDADSGAKARADAERGLRELANWEQPEGVSDADFETLRTQIVGIFAGTAAFGALQQKDYTNARTYYAQALKSDPNDLANNYQMAIASLEATPLDPLGFWYGAKALGMARTQNAQAFQAWAPYFLAKYKRYHGSADDWDQRTATAATQAAPPLGFVAGIPLAPTPCDLAAQAVQQSGTNDLSSSDWELVLSCGAKTPANKAAAEQVWRYIQAMQKNGDARLKLTTRVVAVPDASTLELALSDENQKANKVDLRVTMEHPMTKPPRSGAKIDIIGVISDYRPDPFLFNMTKGELPAAPAPRRK